MDISRELSIGILQRFKYKSIVFIILMKERKIHFFVYRRTIKQLKWDIAYRLKWVIYIGSFSDHCNLNRVQLVRFGERSSVSASLIHWLDQLWTRIIRFKNMPNIIG